jgi:predicted secreted protein
MKLKKIILITLLACFATSLSFAQISKKKVDTLTIKSVDNGKTIAVKKAQTFNVLFEKACRACGSKWHITKSDTSIIKSVKNSYSNPSCTDCQGGYHDHTFEFKALKKGKTSLLFEYFKKQFSIDIIVK